MAAEFDDGALHRVIRLEDIYTPLASALHLDNRLLRYDDAVVHAELDLDPGEHSRTESSVGILDQNLSDECVGDRIHGRIYLINLPGESLSRKGINGDLNLVPDLDLGVVRLRHSHLELYRGYLLDHEYWLTGVKIATVVVTGGHDTAYGRTEICVLSEVVVGPAANFISHLNRIVIRLGNTSFLIKALQAAELCGIVDKFKPGLVELGRIHGGEDLSPRDKGSHINPYRLDPAWSLRGDIVDGVSFHSGGIHFCLRHFHSESLSGGDKYGPFLRESGRIAFHSFLTTAREHGRTCDSENQCPVNVIHILVYYYYQCYMLSRSTFPSSSMKSPPRICSRLDLATMKL